MMWWLQSLKNNRNNLRVLWWFESIVIFLKYHDVLKVLQKIVFRNKTNLTRRVIKISVVLMLHTDEVDCFLTCRLCNLCLEINQEHHCNNLPVSLKFKQCKNLARDVRLYKKKKCNLERWFYTDRDGYVHYNSGWCDVKLNDTSKPCEYCFCLSCGFEKDDQDENFCTTCNGCSK